MTEPSVEDIVAEIEAEMAKRRDTLMIDMESARALIADWRKRGEARDSLEKELDVLGASHKDLAHRLARMGEALKPFAEQQFTGSVWDGAPDGSQVIVCGLSNPPTFTTMGDFRRAHAALRNKKPPR